MCYTTYPHTRSIRAAGSRYISAKIAGPVTRIALILHCITCNVLNYLNYLNVIYISNLPSILSKRFKTRLY